MGIISTPYMGVDNTPSWVWVGPHSWVLEVTENEVEKQKTVRK